ncbi:extracellular solute-binding protein [Microbacterium sp. STN6]|uniref:extracellular solute-binding protein n=1 Tax=Microbacterium sp. STN6 TaxID=2995588 RepID=UPI0022608A42|nr:extracellular solute-binding protein [Microbacterium sp. STN6]MCX7521197.1 extracellular solute-binding protein [Microbacterium sp. STN6]
MRRQLPGDNRLAQLVRLAEAARPTRRQLLSGAAATALTLTLAACAPRPAPRPTAAADRSRSEHSLRWVSQPDYLDRDAAGGHPTLKAFSAKTGIDVSYRESIRSSSDYVSTVAKRLARGDDIGADLTVLDDGMAARLVRDGYVQALAPASLPNAKNLIAPLRGVDYDPKRQWSMPWQGGMAGICWRTDAVPGGLSSISDLWDSSFTGGVGVVTEMRDVMGLIMLSRGVDIAGDWTRDDFYNGLDVVKKQVAAGQFAPVAGHSYVDELRSGAAVVAIARSSDVTLLNAAAGEKWSFALPDSGGTLFSDNLQIPIGSPHRANAESLIDYYYQPAVAAQVAAWVKALCPVDGARDAAAAVDPALAANTLIFPDADILAQTHRFRTLGESEAAELQAAFSDALLGT